MKLQKLIISNFRGLKGENNIIDFANSDIIFLIGQNNVGKSTYLHAYEFFVNPKQVASNEDFYNYDSSNSIVMEGHFLKENDDENDADLSKKGKDTEPDWVSKWVDDNSIVRIKKTWKQGGSCFEKETYSPNDNDWVPNGFGGFDTLFSKYAPEPIFINAMEDEKSLQDKVNKLLQDKYLKTIKDNQSELYNSALESIKNLQNAITETNDVRTLNERLNAHFKDIFSNLSLKIEASKAEEIDLSASFKKNYTVSVGKEGSIRKETFLQNGHGVIRQALFNFISFLKESGDDTQKKYLILFEEPELFLHPKITFKLRSSLYDLANNSPYQILCATHSPMMIDVSKPHSSLIRAIKNDDEETRTYQVGEDVFAKDSERKNRVQMINRFNPHICEAFYADEVLLVEGDTETIVYRDLLKRFYPQKEVYVLNTGSKANIPFFQEVLTAFHIKHCVIHDMDTEKTMRKGTEINNPAWAHNKTIWELIERANKIESGLARRYVHNANFENAHKYNLLSGKDKPLQAFRFAQTIQDIHADVDCLKWLNDYLGDQQINHDMDYINNNAKTKQKIEEEEKGYTNLPD